MVHRRLRPLHAPFARWARLVMAPGVRYAKRHILKVTQQGQHGVYWNWPTREQHQWRREGGTGSTVYLAKLHVLRYEEKARKIQFRDYPSVIMRRYYSTLNETSQLCARLHPPLGPVSRAGPWALWFSTPLGNTKPAADCAVCDYVVSDYVERHSTLRRCLSRRTGANNHSVSLSSAWCCDSSVVTASEPRNPA